jgi:hypothetical protein
MPEINDSAAYRAYLLRCWAEELSAGGRRVWRFSLQSAREGGLYGFASLEGLVGFIRSEIGDIEADHESH